MLPSRSALCALTSTLGLAFFSTAALASASTADLSVTNVDVSPGHEVGATATYVAHVTNYGPDAAEATVTDELGNAEALVSASASQGSCTQTAPATCTLGVVAPGADVTVQVTTTFIAPSDSNYHTIGVAGSTDNMDADFNNNFGAASFAVSEPEAPIVQTPSAKTLGWSRGQAHLDVQAELSPYGAGTYYFEYGKTKAYGSKTAAKDVRGDEDVKRTVRLDGLKMSTVYHYRVVLVVDGKTYRGGDQHAKTFGKIAYPELTLKAARRSASSTVYQGKLDPDGIADAPGSCKGSVRLEVYTLQGATLLEKTTRLGKDCTYKLTLPFGRADARRVGRKGSVLVQAWFSGNYAVAHVGSTTDRP
jgi:hypothetical protein